MATRLGRAWGNALGGYKFQNRRGGKFTSGFTGAFISAPKSTKKRGKKSTNARMTKGQRRYAEYKKAERKKKIKSTAKKVAVVGVVAGVGYAGYRYNKSANLAANKGKPPRAKKAPLKKRAQANFTEAKANAKEIAKNPAAVIGAVATVNAAAANTRSANREIKRTKENLTGRKVITRPNGETLVFENGKQVSSAVVNSAPELKREPIKKSESRPVLAVNTTPEPRFEIGSHSRYGSDGRIGDSPNPFAISRNKSSPGKSARPVPVVNTTPEVKWGDSSPVDFGSPQKRGVRGAPKRLFHQGISNEDLLAGKNNYVLPKKARRPSGKMAQQTPFPPPFSRTIHRKSPPKPVVMPPPRPPEAKKPGKHVVNAVHGPWPETDVQRTARIAAEHRVGNARAQGVVVDNYAGNIGKVTDQSPAGVQARARTKAKDPRPDNTERFNENTYRYHTVEAQGNFSGGDPLEDKEFGIQFLRSQNKNSVVEPPTPVVSNPTPSQEPKEEAPKRRVSLSASDPRRGAPSARRHAESRGGGKTGVTQEPSTQLINDFVSTFAETNQNETLGLDNPGVKIGPERAPYEPKRADQDLVDAVNKRYGGMPPVWMPDRKHAELRRANIKQWSTHEAPEVRALLDYYDNELRKVGLAEAGERVQESANNLASESHSVTDGKRAKRKSYKSNKNRKSNKPKK